MEGMRNVYNRHLYADIWRATPCQKLLLWKCQFKYMIRLWDNGFRRSGSGLYWRIFRKEFWDLLLWSVCGICCLPTLWSIRVGVEVGVLFHVVLLKNWPKLTGCIGGRGLLKADWLNNACVRGLNVGWMLAGVVVKRLTWLTWLKIGWSGCLKGVCNRDCVLVECLQWWSCGFWSTLYGRLRYL